MLADLKRRTPNLTVQQTFSAAPGGLNTGQLILKEGQCINFMAIGSCKSARCSYRHDSNTKAKATWIKSLLDNSNLGLMQ
jgi:hypothetical protein